MVEQVLATIKDLLTRVEQVERDLNLLEQENIYLKEALTEMYKRNKELKENVGKKRYKHSQNTD